MAISIPAAVATHCFKTPQAQSPATHPVEPDQTRAPADGTAPPRRSGFQSSRDFFKFSRQLVRQNTPTTPQHPLPLNEHLANCMQQAGCEPHLINDFKKLFGHPNPNSLYAQNMMADLEHHAYAPQVVSAHVQRMQQFRTKCNRVVQKRHNGQPLTAPGRLEGLAISAVHEALTERMNLKNFRWSSRPMPTLPAEVAQLGHLQRLSIRGAGLRHVAPELADLSASLKAVHLPNNHLAHFPEPLLALPHLKKISLAGNQISTVPEEIKNLSEIKTLDLRHNHFTTFPKALLDLPESAVVAFANNRLSAQEIAATREHIQQRHQAGLPTPKIIF